MEIVTCVLVFSVCASLINRGISSAADQGSCIIDPSRGSSSQLASSCLPVSQYASKVVWVSGEQSDTKGAAKNVLGEPDSPGVGNEDTEWRQLPRGGIYTVAVEFEELMDIEEIEVFETYNAGGTYRIEIVRHDTFEPQVVYYPLHDSKVQLIPGQHVRNLVVNDFTPVRSKQVRVFVTTSASGGVDFIGIDAIKVTGHVVEDHSHYVSKVLSYTSELDVGVGWGLAKYIIGPPDLPNYWGNKYCWGGKLSATLQSITVEFEKMIKIEKVDVFESHHAGGTQSIEVLDGDEFRSVYSVQPKAVGGHIRTVTADVIPSIISKTVRVTVNSGALGNWIGIDAIRASGLIVQENKSNVCQQMEKIREILDDISREAEC